MTIDINRHPCFNEKSRHKFGRVHLPVAPKCNIQCNFCNRKYDCANETRPGVTSSVLSPREAVLYVEKLMEKLDKLSVVGIAGPGDPFANPEETMETLRLVRKKYPEMILCLASNGFGILPYIKELAQLHVSHVTITVNAITPEVGAKVYAWAREGRVIYRGEQAASLLYTRQMEAIRELKANSVLVKVNTIMIPGVNDHCIDEIARRVKSQGADLFNIMPLYPVEDTPFGVIEPPSPESVKAVKDKLGDTIKLMHHCTRCRADAAGMLGQDATEEIALCMQEARKLAERDAPYVAVASMEGMIVNQHLGEASKLWIFQQGENGQFELVGRRDTPEKGSGDQRWLDLANVLNDCRAIVVSGIGPRPRAVMEQMGLRVIEGQVMIDEALRSIYSGTELKVRKYEFSCGKNCGGTGTGCA